MNATITIGDKLPEMIIGPFEADDLMRYAEISGDQNLLHLDEALAKTIGFSAPPVHGMKVLAAFDAMLRHWRQDYEIIGLSGKFVQPLLRGERATLSGRVLRASEKEVFLRLFAYGPSRLPAIIGEATLRPKSLDAT